MRHACVNSHITGTVWPALQARKQLPERRSSLLERERSGAGMTGM
jgi:hypothetical protein